ncbi:MAG: hypothetical protein WC480_04840 [Patescibacteria group bacterium]
MAQRNPEEVFWRRAENHRRKFVQWKERVQRNPRNLGRILVAPLGVTLPCGCETDLLSDRERQIILGSDDEFCHVRSCCCCPFNDL